MPSIFKNDVLSKVVLLVVVLTRFAPGFMNFEKCQLEICLVVDQVVQDMHLFVK